MRRCAFLTLADPTGYVIDDELAVEPLRARGWRVETLPWNLPGVRWEDYDLVVIRSAWDYHHQHEVFLAVLEEIVRRGVRLENRLDLVRWNLRKTYLRDLAERGVAIVPTVWRERLHPGELSALFDEVGGEEIVLKPVVGANADDTYRLSRETASTTVEEIERVFADRPLMVQPFVRSVLDEGEYSLFFFHGELSHAILKTPNPGDFRVQEEHGGILRAVVPEEGLRRAGESTMAKLGAAPLYARVDFVRTGGDVFRLMELELIEPSLYLRMDAAAPRRFAEASDRAMSSRRRI